MTDAAGPQRWEVFVTEAAQREIDRLPRRDRERLLTRFIALGERLDHGELVGNVRKLRGEEDTWRLRSGDYRALFGRDQVNKVLVVFRVGHRRDIYR